MKTTIYSAAFLIAYVLSALTVYAQEKKDDIKGLWLNHDENTVIEIYDENEKYYGKVYEILKLPEDRSKEYSKEQLEKGKEKMKGRLILADLSFKNGKWKNGKILNPKDGSVKANCSLFLAKNRKYLKLKISKGFFSTTKTWKRYENY